MKELRAKLDVAMAELLPLREQSALSLNLQGEVSRIKVEIQVKDDELTQKEKECTGLRSKYLEQSTMLRQVERDAASHARNAADLQQILLDNQLEAEGKISHLQGMLASAPGSAGPNPMKPPHA